jgi:hypothetical protein
MSTADSHALRARDRFKFFPTGSFTRLNWIPHSLLYTARQWLPTCNMRPLCALTPGPADRRPHVSPTFARRVSLTRRHPANSATISLRKGRRHDLQRNKLTILCERTLVTSFAEPGKFSETKPLTKVHILCNFISEDASAPDGPTRLQTGATEALGMD